jgi:hypothetical protein
MAKANNVIPFPGCYEKPPSRRRSKTKSQYELYPLPFFAAKARSTWAVEPSGNYTADYATGKAYALEFLRSCDGTVGWSSLLAKIVGDMIGVGPSGRWPDGAPRINGIVIGFMSTIGTVLNLNLIDHPAMPA